MIDFMVDFFPIETPYSSKEYEIMKNVVNMGIDSHLEGFTKSQFKKSPTFNNKFLWNIHGSELPILYRRLEKMYDQTADEDYESFFKDILYTVTELMKKQDTENMAEMIDPYDPMDANQTINGEPAGNSDLSGEEGIMDESSFEITEEELMEMIQGELGAINNRQIEDTIDDDTIGQEMAAENSSDSLTNKHGENLKPETLIDESYGDRYEQVVFMQGHEADEVMDILNNDGQEAALKHLQQWHYPGEHDGSNDIGAGTQDRTFKKDGYIMSWNSHLPYIGLVFDNSYVPGLDEDRSSEADRSIDASELNFLKKIYKNSPTEKVKNMIANLEVKLGNVKKTVDEDSQMKRHLAGQREKTVPLGQHAPHSQVAKK